MAVPPLPATETALAALYRRIGRVIGRRPAAIHERVIRGIAEAPFSNVTVRTDVPRAEFNYMRERPEQFPGVVVTEALPAPYPHGKLAAQLFGTVSEITTADQSKYKESSRARGSARAASRIRQVPARHRRLHEPASSTRSAGATRAQGSVDQPEQGQRLKLTLDYDLQKAGDAALAQAIATPSTRPAPALGGDGPARRRDPRDGLRAGLRREHVRQAVLAADLRRPDVGGHRRAAAQPRDRVRLSDRLDVQADHRVPRSRTA